MFYYQDFSIQKKMVVGLIIFILFPLFFASFYISHYIVELNAAKRDTYRLNLLETLRDNVDAILGDSYKFTEDCINDANLHAIVKGKGSVLNYQNADKTLSKFVDSKNYCEAICISKNSDVKFQRGKRYISEKESGLYTQMVGQSNGMGIWTDAHKIIEYNGIHESSKMVVSYYRGINDFNTLKSIGTISIHLAEEKFAKEYTEYLRGNSLISMIVDGAGTVISSSDKALIGTNSQLFGLLPANEQSGAVNARYDGNKAILYYSKCMQNDWYILNVSLADSAAGSFVAYALTAIIVCLLFGTIYAAVQQKYIVNPLKQLSARMEQVKSGHLDVLTTQVANDEIGAITKNFEDTLNQVNRLINEVYLEKIKTQEAEREVLVSQMKPHFLYNTLDSIHWLAMRNKDYEVSNQLESLSEIFKHVLNFGKEMLSIEEELDFLKNYCFLQKVRFHGQFEVIFQICENTRKLKIPKLVIQPLVENSIIHGFKTKDDGGKIKIKIRRRQEILEITVTDNGAGSDQRQIRNYLNDMGKAKHAFALKNIGERLKLRYGKDFGLTFQSKLNFGSRVKLTLRIDEDN